MKTMLFILVSGLIFVLLFPMVRAEMSTSTHPVQNSKMAPKMDVMLENIFEMELMSSGEKKVNFETMHLNAQNMLNVIKEIRDEDKQGQFEPLLKTLEKDTKRLHDLAKKKDRQALGYVDRIYESCFKCHSAHRSMPRM